MKNPTCTIQILKQRQRIIQQIRDFFETREILEVSTPALRPFGVTDVHLDSIAAETSEGTHYLQTSPEYAMKQLLAAGSGDIFQICKAYRNHEKGKLHALEFTLLEWYRVNWNDQQLMAEVDTFLQILLRCQPAQYVSYHTLFQQMLNIDLTHASLTDIQARAAEHGLLATLGKQHTCIDDWLTLLFSHCIEPQLGATAPCIVHSYPATQAALAKIENGLAKRFEVYVNGIELANGFEELQDPDEQLSRFQQDNQQRVAMGKPTMDIDRDFIQALRQGLPACSGVALGIDRLVMLALGTDAIQMAM